MRICDIQRRFARLGFFNAFRHASHIGRSAFFNCIALLPQKLLCPYCSFLGAFAAGGQPIETHFSYARRALKRPSAIFNIRQEPVCTPPCLAGAQCRKTCGGACLSHDKLVFHYRRFVQAVSIFPVLRTEAHLQYNICHSLPPLLRATHRTLCARLVGRF